MKYKGFAMSIMMILMMIFGLVVPVAAQGGELPLNCNGLSDADCQILTDASMAMQQNMVTSFTIPAWSGEMNLQAGAESIAMGASGSARMMLPAAMMAMMSDMQPLMGEDGMPDMDAMMAFYAQFDAEMIVSMLEGMGMALVIDNLYMEMPGQSASFTAQGFFKDMGLYMWMQAPNGAESWFGDTLEITPDMMAELDMGLQEAFAEMDNEEMDAAMGMMGDMTGAMMPLMDVMNAHVVNTRDADAELFGQSMYVFTTSFDLQGLLQDEALPAAIMTFLNDPMLAEMAGEEMGAQINETQIQFLLMTVGMLVGETSMSSTQWIGMDDMMTHKMTADVVLDVDLSLMGDPEVPGLTGGMSMMMEMDGVNNTNLDDLVAPAEYASLDMVEYFIFGGPDLIEAELTLGQSYSGSFSEDDTNDLFAITLAAGQTASFEVETDESVYLTVYGPDGFEIESFDSYWDEDMVLDAKLDGQYLIKVEGWWSFDYDLTVRAE